MKINPKSKFITSLLLCLAAFGPKAEAVVPPPDGGYPNFNTAEGQNALFSLSTGAANTAVGWFSLFSNAAGSFNTATGAGSLLFNTADQNTAVGAAALLFNATGTRNTANGTAALLNNTDGNDNTAIGGGALRSNTTGISNTAVGAGALSNIATGIANTAIGKDAGTNVTTANNVICLGSNAFGADVNDSCFIGNIRGITTANADAIPVLIDSNNQLGTVSSSRQVKKDIKPMDEASEAILALKPVSFQYKTDTKGIPQFGLIAEEVAEVNPNLVVRNKNGEIYTVRYDAVNMMVLNEFLKEHRKVEKLEATVADLAARLEKVSAQVQTNDSAAQVAANNH
jgi:Chaperone of endosialidase